MKFKNLIALAGFILLAQMAGIIGSIFTMPAIDSWYRFIAKPELVPPNWVFGPVWTILFVLMGVAAYLVWRKGTGSKRVQIALGVFVLQLVVNTLWSIVFFGVNALGLAVVIIAGLWLLIALNIALFARISKIAAWLLVPYILWVSFASYLSYMIWVLN